MAHTPANLSNSLASASQSSGILNEGTRMNSPTTASKTSETNRGVTSDRKLRRKISMTRISVPNISNTNIETKSPFQTMKTSPQPSANGIVFPKSANPFSRKPENTSVSSVLTVTSVARPANSANPVTRSIVYPSSLLPTPECPAPVSIPVSSESSESSQKAAATEASSQRNRKSSQSSNTVTSGSSRPGTASSRRPGSSASASSRRIQSAKSSRPSSNKNTPEDDERRDSVTNTPTPGPMEHPPLMMYESLPSAYDLLWDSSEAMNAGQLPPPSAGKITHHNVELLFEDAFTDAREQCGNPKAALRVFVECKTDQGEWEKVYTGLSKSYIHAGLQASKSYSFRSRIDSSAVKSEWSVPTTVKTHAAPFTGDDLHHAIRRGNIEKAKEILLSGDVSADAQDERDNSALTIAGLQQQFEIMELLIQHEADVNRKDASGKTPLIQAASRDALEAVKFLCENGADVKLLDKSGMAAIHHAVDGGYVKMVEWMLDNSEKYGFDIEQMETSNGMTPLNRCANMTPDSRAYELAASLQLRGAEMSTRSYASLTPLMNAVIRKKPRLVDFFLARGADIYERNENGKTAYDLAQSVQHTQILRAFEEKVQQLNMLPKAKRKTTPTQEVQIPT
ncbi:fibronectin type 3 and ankyrin repeat domains 1 protein [Aplysia californica]|uniref:Fibronectin type 3 and ankyrin repeat domains 1 protein n=1 Tax=Aplysia californica TaxID=6500 RepID=A0ABM0KBG5_APLCA|nr:fibronectin type 3 and ankyrin repeat domains 1 protein [Aplysia californica]